MDEESRVAWYADEAGFAAQLARGRQAEIRLAATLLPLGLWMRVGGFDFRDAIADVSRFADEKDIEVEGGHLLEIKSRGFPFTSPADYPYETAYVGARRRWEAREERPCTVVLLSEVTGAYVLAPTRHYDEWVEESARDERRGFVETSMAAPRRCLYPAPDLRRHLLHPCRPR